MSPIRLALVSFLALQLAACAYTAEDHRAAVSNTDKDRISVGTAQREIKVGMSNADVVEVLGSPSMVTTDDQRRESWIYDKISTEKVYSTSSGGLGLIFGGIGGPVGGAAGGSFSSGAGAASTTQRTLTIIIKFDAQGHVRDYAYHSSSF
jgi:outer membrane protein assembly factor BamE (lipoprotein component of BamABCDE complex)